METLLLVAGSATVPAVMLPIAMIGNRKVRSGVWDPIMIDKAQIMAALLMLAAIVLIAAADAVLRN